MKKLFLCCITVLALNSPAISQTALVGMTAGGGVSLPGNIFSIVPGDTSLQQQYTFETTVGRNPGRSQCIEAGGKLYGMTSSGGADGAGVIFQYDYITDTYTKKIDFDYYTNGGSPYGSLMLAANG